ncbi:EAL domain-containing protein [Alteromonas ponticola]|uniref:EAL domain-containing protein n=1 Tax=Alteromonas aquimaris TaxID=2998417 RepID=A0ABT3P6P7_9ALTE|nr:EAL domain-containing protein [Alteromonas aquimaris]MCW8108434.1 EAL domain-containing protein [Alteromonas aquimaris]
MRFGNVDQEELETKFTDHNTQSFTCDSCKAGQEFESDFSMAFQPLVDLSNRETYGYEALVRGPNGEPAYTVINQVTAENIYQFDQTCRVKAICLAAEFGLDKTLSINFLPGAINKPDICIRKTLVAAEVNKFPISLLNFEMVETDHVTDIARLENIARYYQQIGLSIALDDFGSGYANLDWLAYLNPNSIKIDISLVKDIDQSPKRKLIVKQLKNLTASLGIEAVAEGVETKAERDVLAEIGITKQQGFYFARPQFEQFINVPDECYR